MAKQIMVVDDITGEPDADTVTIGYGGRAYNIDLTEEGRAELKQLLRPYIQFGQDVGQMTIHEDKRRRTQPLERHHPESGRHTKEEVAALKKWAAKLGIEVPLARIPNDIWAAWRADKIELLRPGRLPDSEPSPRQKKVDEAMADAS